MHPLSIFPSLLTFGLISPLLLRLSVGLFILFLAKDRYKKTYKWSAVVYFLSGLMIILGLYTQIAVLFGAASLKFDFWVDYWRNRKTTPIKMEIYFLYGIAGIILLSLLFTGPGFLAFDLPL